MIHLHIRELPATERCFFVATDGSIGLCPNGSREGDLIVILCGGNTPYLLRKVPDSESHFEFVGECFVDGLVDGDFMRRTKSNGLAPRTFALV